MGTKEKVQIIVNVKNRDSSIKAAQARADVLVKKEHPTAGLIERLGYDGAKTASNGQDQYLFNYKIYN